MLTIHQRPFPPEDRSQPGHWEGDLIIGKDQRSAIGTLVERQTRMVRLLHLLQRDGDTLHEALKARMADLPSALLRMVPPGLLDPEAFYRLPPVTKPELMAHFDDWVTDPRVTRTGVEQFVADLDNLGRTSSTDTWSSLPPGRPGCQLCSWRMNLPSPS
jgi:hypothetical protein